LTFLGLKEIAGLLRKDRLYLETLGFLAYFGRRDEKRGLKPVLLERFRQLFRTEWTIIVPDHVQFFLLLKF